MALGLGLRGTAMTVFLMVSALYTHPAQAQVGDLVAGARSWDQMCDNCHGKAAEGGFGPDLAGGRGLTLDQFRHAIRHPWGVMPALNEHNCPIRVLRTCLPSRGRNHECRNPGSGTGDGLPRQLLSASSCT